MSAQRLALLVQAVLGAALAAWATGLLGQSVVRVATGAGAGAGLRVHVAVSLLLALGHAVLLALPLILLLERHHPLTRGRVLVLAVLIAVLPLGVWEFPARGVPAHTTTVIREGATLVPLIVDGAPTPAGWLRYLRELLGLGVLGLVGGEVFWRVRQAGLRAQAAMAPRSRRP